MRSFFDGWGCVIAYIINRQACNIANQHNHAWRISFARRILNNSIDACFAGTALAVVRGISNIYKQNPAYGKTADRIFLL